VDAVHLVLTGGAGEDPDGDPVVAQVFDCVRALAAGPAARRPLDLTAVLDGTLPAAGTAVTCPARAGVLGVLRTARAEHPSWDVRCLDLETAGDVEPEAGAETVLRAPSGHPVLRSEEHTSELQSRENLVCRLLLEKKKKTNM